ncbi:MAG TPA: hypothetical protein VK158_03280 [Acidobacteriota bacterium]|nr:hypothetical protein [Acidobacteriota bacterium]
MKPTSVFVLYANEAHSEVSTQKYLEAVKPGSSLDTILNIITQNKIPLAYSTQGIDLDMLHVVNPKAYEILTNTPHISLINGTYTHVLPTFHPEQFDDQMHFANKVDARAYMFPEFDVPRFGLRSIDGPILLCEQVNNYYDYKRELFANASKTTSHALNVQASCHSLTGIVTQSAGNMRNMYLKMLRGVESVDATLSQFQTDAILASHHDVPVVFLTDLEAYIINEAKEKLCAFLDAYGSQTECVASTLNKQVIHKYDMLAKTRAPTRISTRPKQKWITSNDPHGIFDSIRAIDDGALPEYFLKALFEGSTSDVYSAQLGLNRPDGYLAKLPKTGAGTQEIVIKSDAQRIAETLHLLECVRSRTPVHKRTHIALSPASQEKMEIFHRVFARD